jgi:hypothetical protein
MSSRIKTFALIVSVVAALFALPATAGASGTDVIKDCTYDGHIDGNWSQADYEEAEQQLNGDNDSYSDCRELIAQGRAGAGSNNDSGSGSSGSGSSGSGDGGSGGGSSSGSGSGSGSGSSDSGSSGGSGSSSDKLDGRAGSPTPGTGDPNLATASGAYAPTAEDKAAYEQARGTSVLPTELAAGSFNQNAMPLPVLIALVAVGLLVVATSALVARKRLPAVGRGAARLVRR